VINAHSERKDVVVGAVYGEERKPNRDSGHTEIKDESSKTEVKDIDLDETQLSKLDQPGVDVDL
jgi:hypothetical protein